ncbi:MAG: PLP-dependent transferase [Dehalococcoidia bacterium]
MERPLSPATLLARADKKAGREGEPTVAQPQLAAAYHLDGPAEGVAHTYGRQANSSWEDLEGAFASLTGGVAVSFASGIAAAAATIEVLSPAERPLAIVEDGYYGIRRLAEDTASRSGRRLVLLPSAGDEAVALINETRPGLVWLESPTNPGLQVTDLRAVSEVCVANGARLVLDETLVTPLGRNPLEYGADVAVYSATKYISGHSDILMGLALTADESLAAELRSWRHSRGAIPGPFEAWLCLRGMKTLELRLSRQCANAQVIAEWLEADGRLRNVCYPGLASSPFHNLARRDMKLFGGVVTADAPDAATADELVRRLELFTDATSFGGIASSVDRRSRWSGEAAADGLLRFSVGCESVDDLMADLDQGLAHVFGS